MRSKDTWRASGLAGCSSPWRAGRPRTRVIVDIASVLSAGIIPSITSSITLSITCVGRGLARKWLLRRHVRTVEALGSGTGR